MSRSIVGLSLFGFLALAGCSSDSTTPATTAAQTGGSGTGTGGSTAGNGGAMPGNGGSATGGSPTGAGGSSAGGATTGNGGSTGTGGSSTGTPSYADAKAWIDAYHAAHPGREGDITIMTPAQLAADPDAARLHSLCGPDQLPVIPLLTWEYGGNDHAWINADQSPLVICVYIAVNPSTAHFDYDATADHITADVYVLFPQQNPCKDRTGADQVLGCVGDPTNLEILVDTSSINDGADVGLALANSSTDVMLLLSDASKVLLYQNI